MKTEYPVAETVVREVSDRPFWLMDDKIPDEAKLAILNRQPEMVRRLQES
jgi:hypothetical protein